MLYVCVLMYDTNLSSAAWEVMMLTAALNKRTRPLLTVSSSSGATNRVLQRGTSVARRQSFAETQKRTIQN